MRNVARADALIGRNRFPELGDSVYFYTSARPGPGPCDSERLADALASRGVLVWSGAGFVRLSLHVMNSLDDLESLASALGEVLADLPPPLAEAFG